MDDLVFLDLMKQAYCVVDGLNREIDGKAYSMVGVLGVIFTIQSTLLLNLFSISKDNLLLFVLLLVSLSCYIVSIFFFIRCIKPSSFLFYPTSDVVVQGYLDCLDERDMVNGLLGDYTTVVENNNKLIEVKSMNLLNGFRYFKIGLVSMIVLFIVYGGVLFL